MASEGGKSAGRDVVSMDQIEQFKENIQPVRGGRSATSLARTMHSSSTVLLELEQMKQKFEQQIESDETEAVADPLTTWLKYVSWAQKNYPRNNSSYKTILERCTKKYGREERFRENKMMLQLWIMMADTLIDPSTLFSFLHVNRIGVCFAVLYEAEASFYENRQMFEKAKKVFEYGLKERAIPYKRLERHYKEFLSRMDKALKQQKENEDGAPKSRSALSTLSTSRRGRGGLSQRGAQQQQQEQQGGEKAGGVGWFQIYEEGEDENGEKKGGVSNEQFKGAKELAYLWGDLASEREKDKENNLVPSTWSGLKLPQNKAFIPPKSTDQFEIFDESEAESKQPMKRSKAPETNTLEKNFFELTPEKVVSFEEFRASLPQYHYVESSASSSSPSEDEEEDMEMDMSLEEDDDTPTSAPLIFPGGKSAEEEKDEKREEGDEEVKHGKKRFGGEIPVRSEASASASSGAPAPKRRFGSDLPVSSTSTTAPVTAKPKLKSKPKPLSESSSSKPPSSLSRRLSTKGSLQKGVTRSTSRKAKRRSLAYDNQTSDNLLSLSSSTGTATSDALSTINPNTLREKPSSSRPKTKLSSSSNTTNNINTNTTGPLPETETPVRFMANSTDTCDFSPISTLSPSSLRTSNNTTTNFLSTANLSLLLSSSNNTKGLTGIIGGRGGSSGNTTRIGDVSLSGMDNSTRGLDDFMRADATMTETFRAHCDDINVMFEGDLDLMEEGVRGRGGLGQSRDDLLGGEFGEGDERTAELMGSFYREETRTMDKIYEDDATKTGGFEIYDEDKTETKMGRELTGGFDIYDENKTEKTVGFEIYEEKEEKTAGFEIYEEKEEKTAGFEIYDDNKTEKTVGFEIYEEKEEKTEGFEIYDDNKTDGFEIYDENKTDKTGGFEIYEDKEEKTGGFEVYDENKTMDDGFDVDFDFEKEKSSLKFELDEDDDLLERKGEGEAVESEVGGMTSSLKDVTLGGGITDLLDFSTDLKFDVSSPVSSPVKKTNTDTPINFYHPDERAKQESLALAEMVENGVPFHDHRGMDPNLKSLRNCGIEPTLSVDFASTSTFNLSDLLLLGDSQMYVHHKIASGAYGEVFKVEVVDEEEEEREGEEREGGDYTVVTQKLQVNPDHFRALKWIKSNSVWEYSIFNKLKKRSVEEGAEKLFQFFVLEMESFHLYRSSSFLVMPVVVCGTLNDVINKYQGDVTESKRVVPEELAVVYSYYVMKAVAILHGCGMIHSDVKPDNFLVAMGRVEEVKRLPAWEGQMEGGWGKFALKLIDFGQTIDTRTYTPPSSSSSSSSSSSPSLAPVFTGNHHRSGFRSAGVVSGRGWCFDVDLYGVAGIIHLLLFAKYMETEKGEGGEVCTTKFARYQQHWKEVFDRLVGYEEKGEGFRRGEMTKAVLDECCDLLVKYLTSNTGKQRSLRLTFCRLINKMKVNTKL